LGHKVVLIIGTFTAKIGDPTGRNEMRKMMTDSEVEHNIARYLEQVSKILDLNKIEIVYNSEWLADMNLEKMIKVLSYFTVAQMTSREDFANRLNSGIAVSMVELLYPVLQAYDSVHVRADVELGGSDQTFNLLRGRDLQKSFGQEPQVCITFPILEGTSGVQKTSKTLNNYISLLDTSRDIFGKVMSIPDSLIVNYYELAAYASNEVVKNVKEQLESKSVNPMVLKKQLAFDVTKLYFGDEIAKSELDYFNSVFSKDGKESNLDELEIIGEVINSVDLIFSTLNIVESKSEARRLVDSGAFKLNNISIKEHNNIEFNTGDILKIGKKHIFKLVKKI